MTEQPGIEDLPNLFRRLRGNMTQDEAAAIAGVPRSSWGKVESSHAGMSFDRLMDVLRRFGFRAVLEPLSPEEHADALLDAEVDVDRLASEEKRALGDPSSAYVLLQLNLQRRKTRELEERLAALEGRAGVDAADDQADAQGS